eukprot:1104982-Rhodomonas_salina.3
MEEQDAVLWSVLAPRTCSLQPATCSGGEPERTGCVTGLRRGGLSSAALLQAMRGDHDRGRADA